MPGELRTNPYMKTFDELQRSIKRMENYLNINNRLLDQDEIESLEIMIDAMHKALSQIPKHYRKTKHQYSKK